MQILRPHPRPADRETDLTRPLGASDLTKVKKKNKQKTLCLIVRVKRILLLLKPMDFKQGKSHLLNLIFIKRAIWKQCGE